jgi:hypothetical protein
MDIFEASTAYEDWMRDRVDVVETHLKSKHAHMRKDLFRFLKGTFYRWIELWPTNVADEIRTAPTILACGDVHVDSFGTWRDLEGRLVWGIDDFDEAYQLPYTNDLVRLVASVKIAVDSGLLKLPLREASDVIVESYRHTLDCGGAPITLAEQEHYLEHLGIEAIKPVRHFWKKLNHLPVTHKRVPRDARRALEKSLPGGFAYKLVRRIAGTGSLGQPRFVAIGDWKGGCVAREAKAIVPSACVWRAGQTRDHNYSERLLKSAIRAHDPFQSVREGWLIRRLSPDSNPIEIFRWPKERDETVLLRSMGREVANIHLANPRRIAAVMDQLKSLPGDWLHASAKTMAKALEKDWKHYRN